MLNLKILLCALGMLALSLGAVACGDDDDDATTSAETTSEDVSTVTVTAADDVEAAEYTFDLSATPTADTEAVTFENAGTVAHELIFARINEGFTTDEAIELQGEKGSAEIIGTSQGPIPPDESIDVRLRGELDPGSYAMLCALGAKEGAHFELGQLEEFEIE